MKLNLIAKVFLAFVLIDIASAQQRTAAELQEILLENVNSTRMEIATILLTSFGPFYKEVSNLHILFTENDQTSNAVLVKQTLWFIDHLHESKNFIENDIDSMFTSYRSNVKVIFKKASVDIGSSQCPSKFLKNLNIFANQIERNTSLNINLLRKEFEAEIKKEADKVKADWKSITVKANACNKLPLPKSTQCVKTLFETEQPTLQGSLMQIMNFPQYLLYQKYRQVILTAIDQFTANMLAEYQKILKAQC